MTAPSNRDDAELAGFARHIVLTLAVPALAQGYADLVAKFRNDALLAEAVKQHGIDAALSEESGEMARLRKSNKELVTAAEKIAERRMTDAVLERYPSHAVVGEEHGFTPGSDTRWVFDPVDGTSAMIRCAMTDAFGLPAPVPLPAFGITAGIVRGDEAVIGIVVELTSVGGQLHMGNIWEGSNAGTTCNGQLISPITPPDTLAQATLASTVPQVMFGTAEKWGGFQALAEATRQCITDQNCIGFMHLLSSEKKIDIVYEADLAYHDVAALVPILQAAGITTSNAAGNKLRFPETAIGTEFSILAASALLHKEALTRIRKGVEAGHNSFSARDAAGKGYAQKFSS